MTRALRSVGADVVPLIEEPAPPRGGLSPYSSQVSSAETRRVVERLRAGEFDVVFAPHAPAEIASVDTDVPVIYFTDATFALLRDYYPEYSHLPADVSRAADEVEHRAIESATVLCYSTPWAAESAVRDYGADATKVVITPFGPHLDELPTRADATSRHVGDVCRLLLVGRNWERKGGDIALGAADALRACGVPVELTVCGCEPPRGTDRSRLTVIPDLDKSDPRQRNRLAQLYRQSDFFLLPTRAECFGIVFAEAAAFGVPSVTAATGGVPWVVIDGENGRVLPQNATAADYAARIGELWADHERYVALVGESRRAYEQRLNWTVWSQAMGAVLAGSCGSGRASPWAGDAEDSGTIARSAHADLVR